MPTIPKEFAQLVYQSGNYMHTEDKTDWSNLPLTGSYATVMVGEDLSKPGEFTLDPTDIPHRFPAVVGAKGVVYFYLVTKAVTGKSSPALSCIWEDDKVYYTDLGVAGPPSETPVGWHLMTNADISYLDNDASRPLGFTNYIYFRATSVAGDFQLTNHGEHSWTIDSTNGNMTKIILKTYDLVETAVYNFNDDTFTLLTPSDGLWIAEITMADGTTNYVEIYDFTKIEQCYLNLMRTTLCECIDCEDCPDEGYTRALTFANMYLLIRDIAYADRWAAGGFTSTEILRTDYVNTYGMLIEKLKLMANKCTCDE